MNSEDGEHGGLSPQEVARILSREIAEELNARLANPEQDDADSEAFGDRILDLYNQSVSLLIENGHETLVSEMFSTNMNYYNRLLMFSMSQRFVESLPEDRSSLQEALSAGFEQVAERAHSKPLNRPSFDDFEDRFPAGYEDLFKAVFVVDEMFNRSRYEGMRRLTSGLLNFGENPGTS